jgi:hypothetical protein
VTVKTLSITTGYMAGPMSKPAVVNVLVIFTRTGSAEALATVEIKTAPIRPVSYLHMQVFSLPNAKYLHMHLCRQFFSSELCTVKRNKKQLEIDNL